LGSREKNSREGKNFALFAQDIGIEENTRQAKRLAAHNIYAGSSVLLPSKVVPKLLRYFLGK
jgi:hypothetical protein